MSLFTAIYQASMHYYCCKQFEIC